MQHTGLVECLEDNAAEQLFIHERIAKILPNVSTFADFAKLLQSEGVKIRVKKQSGQLLYKAADLDGTWIPADALGDGFTLSGLETSMKSGLEGLDEGHGTPIADLYRELTTEYPQNCDTPVRLTARQICSAGKRGVLLQIQDANGNPAKLMMDNQHIHTTSDGAVTADISAAFSYDITYDDGTHGTIRGTDLIRQIDEENLTQPLTVSLTADQIMAMSLRGVTVHLPQYGIERLFIPERYVQRNAEQGTKLRNKIAELRSKSKIYAATAHDLQACRTYKSVWLEYASKPLTQKDTFYKQNEAALQAYSRAASQLDKMGIALGTEPEKVRQLVTETEYRIADLIAELEKVRKSNRAMQEDKEKVEQIQSG